MITAKTLKAQCAFLFLCTLLCSGVLMQGAQAELFNTKHKNNTPQVSPAKKKQTTPAKGTPVKVNGVVAGHMKNMGAYCADHWERETCLKELSSLAMDMVSEYGALLEIEKKEAAKETLKQHCAASTAALKVSVPAYAMRSAITECANTISDIHGKTSVKPDLNLYQLFVGAALCLGDEPSCKEIEQTLKSHQ